MKLVLSHATGNEFVRALVAAMLQANVLAEFHTMLAVKADAWWLELLPPRERQLLRRRVFSVPAAQTWSNPLRELARMVLPRLGLHGSTVPEQGWASLDAVYQNFDLLVSRRLSHLQKKYAATSVYAYEDGALATFTQAKAQGMRCVYDLPIAYWETSRQLLLEEAERLPSWAPTLGGGIFDSASKLARKVQELELADVVVGPSKFVLDSLPAWASTKQVIIVPFGSPTGHAQAKVFPPGHAQKPLRILFAGSMGQRKGLGDLFAAIRQLNRPDVELVVLGTPLAPLDFYRRELPQFTFEPGRPHAQVLALMRTCDVFCLPSIVEGRALVMQEAMSQGLPLIITPNTGGEDLVQEGKTGFLVPIRSPQAIAEKITWFLNHRQQLPEMSRLAQAYAVGYTWQNYGAAILAALAGPVA